MEAAGLVFGVIPIAVEVFKAWSLVRRKAIAYTKASQQTSIDLLHMCVHEELYRSELTAILVAAGITRSEASVMLGDEHHSRWSRIDGRITDILGQSEEVYVELARHIATQLRELRKELTKFEIEYKKWTLKDVKTRVRFVYSHPDLDKLIKALKDDNGSLRDIGELQRSLHTTSTKAVSSSLPGYRSLAIARRACVALGSALSGHWSCSDAPHKAHHAALDVLPRSKNELNDNVTLRFALNCTAEASNAVHTSLPRPGNCSQSRWHLLLATASERRRQSPKDKLVLNSTTTTSVCSQLARCLCADALDGYLGCLPLADSPGDRQGNDLFHDSDRCGGKLATPQANLDATTVLTQSQWFQGPKDQCRLAHSISHAALCLHATEWLADNWHLRNFALVDNPDLDDKDCPEALKTLYVSMPLQENKPVVSSHAPASPVTATRSSHHGLDGLDVPNIVLFQLGIALLEIEFQKPLQDLKISSSETDIETARRLLKLPNQICQRYRDLAKRCLRCNFGLDNDDLADEDLQQAVFATVVNGLKDLENELP